MSLIKKCKICKSNFQTKSFFVKNGGGKYCSKVCHYRGLKKGKTISCFICQKENYKSPQSIKRSKSGKFFCSKSCQTKWRNQEFIGPKHANWTSGRNSYRSVLDRYKISRICTLCKSSDERILAVHHVDSNRLNNEVSNLAWLCHNCHFLAHHDGVERQRFMYNLNKRQIIWCP